MPETLENSQKTPHNAGEEVPGAGGAAMPALEGDFSLNAANAISASLLLRAGLSRLAPTHDLNAQQINALARRLGPAGCACWVCCDRENPSVKGFAFYGLKSNPDTPGDVRSLVFRKAGWGQPCCRVMLPSAGFFAS